LFLSFLSALYIFPKGFYISFLKFVLKRCFILKKTAPGFLIILIAFGFIIGIGLFTKGSLTGQFSATVPMTNGAVLSALAAVLSIGVLIVAGLKKK